MKAPVVTNKKRILWLSDSPTANTGFGVVAKNLIDQICAIMGKNVEIVLVGVNNHESEPIIYNSQVTIIDGRVDRSGQNDPFCRHAFLDILFDNPEGFDGCFIFHNINLIMEMVPSMIDIRSRKKAKNQKSFGAILYTPVDGMLTKRDHLEHIAFFDLIATYTDYGVKELTRHRPELKKKIKAIPHGNNPKHYYPIPAEQQGNFRAEFFGEKNADKVIFCNVNRNQPRKNLPACIYAFEDAVQRWTGPKKLFLYLHCDRHDIMGNDLTLIMEQTSLVEFEDYMFAPESFFDKTFGVETSVLNQIYNASDIYVTTTLAEGWGLGVTEAMATRKPVIMPLTTSLIEIAGPNAERCYPLTNLQPFTNVDDNVRREIVDVFEVSDVMMEAAHQHLDKTDGKMKDLAEQYVKTLSWKTIAQKFVNYIEEYF